MWAQLQDQIRIRTKRLASAAEIHRFNRDLNELIARIQEKDASLSMEDLGRDMDSVQGLQRKHEGHERDLLAVEQQVETLSAESAKLQVAYQGNKRNHSKTQPFRITFVPARNMKFYFVQIRVSSVPNEILLHVINTSSNLTRINYQIQFSVFALNKNARVNSSRCACARIT